jgi:large subunit ribosomal protein L21
MFAVIKTGGKQYRVAENDVIVVEKLSGDAGDTLVFGEVLMIANDAGVELGAPVISGAQVVGEVVEQRRGAKVIIIKKKQRNTYRRKKGHRQSETVVKITEILAKGGKSPAKAAASAKSEPTAASGGESGDNLSKLTGVGKVMAGKLNEAGFSTFAQLAAMTAEQFAALDESIFKGRVPMEQLVSEARSFAG